MRTALHTSLLVAVAMATAACGGGDPDPVATSTPSPSTAPEAATSTPTPTTSPDTDPTSTPATSDPDADCSTQDVDVTGADLDRLPDEARETATFLLDAASRCDEQLLATAAAESETSLGFGDEDPYEATAMRDAGSGYLGWRVGIRGDGTWMFLVAGD